MILTPAPPDRLGQLFPSKSGDLDTGLLMPTRFPGFVHNGLTWVPSRPRWDWCPDPDQKQKTDSRAKGDPANTISRATRHSVPGFFCIENHDHSKEESPASPTSLKHLIPNRPSLSHRLGEAKHWAPQLPFWLQNGIYSRTKPTSLPTALLRGVVSKRSGGGGSKGGTIEGNMASRVE